MKCVIFDLDGTISDSSEGIHRSINYALSGMGAKLIKLSDVNKYIGPPLADSFSELIENADEKIIDEAVRLFREDYSKEGFMINEIYDGMTEVITNLYENGYKLFIATTKKYDIAIEVIKYFELEKYFNGIYGGGSENPKEKLLNIIICEHNLDKEKCVMIGDTHYDISSAKINGISSIGVKWGFGHDDELAYADITASNPSELTDYIKKMIG